MEKDSKKRIEKIKIISIPSILDFIIPFILAFVCSVAIMLLFSWLGLI